MDEDYDQRWGVGPNGSGTTGNLKLSPLDVLGAVVQRNAEHFPLGLEFSLQAAF